MIDSLFDGRFDVLSSSGKLSKFLFYAFYILNFYQKSLQTDADAFIPCLSGIAMLWHTSWQLPASTGVGFFCKPAFSSTMGFHIL